MQGLFKFFQIFTLVFYIGSNSAIASADQLQENKFATVFHLQGDVSAKAKSGEVRKLKQGGIVLAGETLVAGPASEAVLKTSDAGIVAIRPNTELVIQKYNSEGKSTDQQVLYLVSGSLRIISGWIGKINPQQQRVVTPGATIGIRGTDHEPYVLLAQAENSKFSQGTYDKVNRGQTYLEANGAGVEIDKGLVGYVRDRNAQGKRQRAILTLLMPVLLDAVPDFYVGGSFDKELDLFSAKAGDAHNKALAELNESSESIQMPSTEPAVSLLANNLPIASQEIQKILKNPELSSAACPYINIGQEWLTDLDAAIAKRDSKLILQLFSADVIVKATVRTTDQPKTYSFNREEMVKSTLASINNLKNYQQRREKNTVEFAAGSNTHNCKRLLVKSIAIEEGQMNERPFRFEALEEYTLENRRGTWQAVLVTTYQK